ncbi:MAG: DNA polymerase III subunit beta, partial [Rhodospirillaceae bacterium]|nr:DNA polymerase III subunit beta [Rhodospirillaceae bacterium]
LYDIVRKLPEGAQVQMEAGGAGGQATLRSGRSRFVLATLPREDFPAIAAGDLPCHFMLSATSVRDLIDRTRFAISTEETRYYLNGIYLHVAQSPGGPVLRAVATDGHRLARVEVPLPRGADKMPGVIVPRKTVGELRKLIEDTEENVGVALSDTRIRFSFDDVILTSKLIDGTFPDYQRVIPTGNDKVLEVDRKSFAEAVDRVSTVSSEKSRAVKLTLKPGSLTLSANSPESGSASEELEVSYQGAGMEIGFNARYLLDIATQIDGAGAQFALADAASPTLVRDVADPSALYVLMPMRV